MKRKLLLLWTFLLCFAAGSLAAEITIDFSAKGYVNGQEISTVVQDGVTVTFDKGTNNNTPKFYTSGNAIRVYGGGTMTVSSGSNITSIAVTFGSSDGSNALKTDVGTLTEGTWTGSSSSVVFSIGGSSGHRRFRSLTITTGEAPSIVKPTITGKTPFYGSTEVTIASTTEGAEIRYTLDGTEPTVESTLYTAPFTLSESATVKAIAVKDGNVSEAVSKAFVAMTAYSTIAEVNALSDATPFAFTGSAVVVASPSTRYTYIKDATGNSLIYTANKQFEVGSVIAPTWTGKVSIYNNLIEIVPTSELTVIDGQKETIEYPEVTAADVTKENMNKVVVLKGVTYTTPDEKKNFTITQNGVEVAGYNSIGITIDAPIDGKTYDIVGAISVYKENAQFAPISITEAVAAEPEAPVWRDFQVDLTAYNDPSSLLTADEIANKANFEFGIKVAEDGTLSRVEATDATANAVISGKYHNDHGCTGVKVVIPVYGPTKIGVGNCSYSNEAKITDANGNAVATLAINKLGCWSRKKTDEAMAFAYYDGEATTLTIESSSYTPAVSFKAIKSEDIPHNMVVEYALGESGATGVLPAGFELNAGEKFAIPTNTTLYVDGKTLTGWTDGTKTYAIGEEITAVADTKITLTPVFTENTVTLADRTEAVTVKWNFRADQGATRVGFQGNAGIYVAQAVVNGKTIDVKMDIDATSGKFNNQGHNDWVQINSGTKLTIPACKGAVVSFESFSATTTTTIAGEVINQETTTPEYTYNGDAESVDIVIGDGSYYRYVQVVLPVVEQGGGETPETPTWRDIKADFTNGAIITSEETNVISVGLSVAEDGTVSRVAADDANANAVVSGKFHSTQHGLGNFSATVKVEGPVKIGMGTCAWGSDVTVKNEKGETVANTFNTNTGACWATSDGVAKNVVYTYYKGEAATLTIAGGSYTPYFSVEKVALEDIPTVMKVEYSLGDTGAAGILPANFEINDGEKFATPKNFTLYVEGKTLTGWSDGTKTYAIGEEITAVADTKITLTPVFTANEVSLADRTEAVTLKWDFQQKNGAPVVGFQNKTGVWVTQAVVNGKTIDVKTDFDTNNGGKFANGSWQDWAQLNGGTKFTIPSCKGAVVTMESYSATTTTTVAGETINQETKTPTYTYNGTSETIDVVIGDGSYWRYIQVVLPVVEAEAPSTWRDIKADFTNGAIITSEETNVISVGLSVAEDGTVSRVAADDANANAVVSGKFHSNEHGLGNFSATVKVEGPVKIGMGTCAWGGNVTVKDENGQEVALAFNTNDGTCWHNEKHVIYTYYKGEAATLTIAGGNYTPYFSVEKVALEDIPSNMKVTYALGESGATGVVPAGGEFEGGKTFTIPVNKTLYVEGKTLTGWTDGTNTYAVGQEVTAVAGTQVELTPVFIANEVSLADRTEAVTLKWDFQQKNGAPVVAWQNTTGHVWVAQATIGGKTIDVKCDISTSPGKLANGNWQDWAQMNEGTKITIPSCKGAVVSVEAYNALGAGDGKTYLTIDGQSDYASANTIEYTIANKAETIDVVIGNEGSYYRYVQVVLPVVESEAPVIQERAIINTGFEDWNSVSAEGGPLDIATQFSNETITFNFVGTSCQPTGMNEGKFGSEVGFLMAEKNAQGTVTTTAFKNITKVRYYHGATGGNRGWGLQKKSANDADWVTISSDFANPATGVWVEKEINEENVQLRWYNLDDAQNAYMFNLEVYANVEITAEQVSLTTAVAPEEAAGKVSVYPVSSSYDVGTELKLTATENFGYDFVNWTNSLGEEVSAEPVFTYTLNANETLTANFKKVNTYELALTVEGGANDYMIAFNPAPTVVDGKNMYEAGTVVELAASSNPILTFANWGDGQTNGTISVTMDADQTVTAIYSAGDYIVGWDFIKRGNNGRPADFASTVDNETAALIMTNASGKVSGWLDKSKEAANGYETFVGAAVNWQALADKYYYQTKINASEFMNIKVQAEMMYNYNAYKTQTIEYSIDGTNWTKVGEATMPGVKTGTPIEAVLPAEANNAPELYIRFIPDYTSQIDGTESNNDGTTITNIFIFGEKKIVDDGVAPKFVSSVPANDATGASATGKIVVNFDEKVKLTATASATLNGKAMEGTVAGKTITFPYVGLEYNTPYSFVLAAGSVADLTDNTLAEAITVNFTTMDRPSVAKAEYDAIVTNIDELKDALNKATGSARFRIFLHDGTYDFKTATLTNVKGNVSLIGESTEGTILRNDPQAEGIGITAILCTGGENIYMQDLTLMSTDYERPGNNGEGGSIGRCVVLQENASKAVYKNVNLLSHQDTYYTRATQRAYWEGGKIAGTVDYLCGGGDIFFNGVTLYNNARSNGDCITAPATSSNWGYVFSDCIIDGDAGQDGRYTLGRPWQGAPRAVYLNTTMKILPTGAGWGDMGAVPGLFAEFNSHTESGALVDCSARKTSFTVDGTSHSVSYNPVLTQAEAEKYTIANVVGGTDNWQPELLTEQAPAPTNVVLEGYELKWDDSKYALLWAVCKNGSVVAFVTTPTYTVDDTTAEWSVRAANEMGGLCPAVTAGESTGIENIEQAADDNAPMYNVAGQRVTKSAKGIVIQNGHKYVRK